MGDSAAMMVDALTYLFNLLAERQKARFRDELTEAKRRGDSRAFAAQSLECRKRTLQMELLPPVISVTTLLIVTGFVLRQAIKVLLLDRTRDVSEQKNPNVTLMLAFSCGNLVLDIVNVTCFAKAEHALGYNTDDAPPPEGNEDGQENGRRNERPASHGKPKHKIRLKKTKSDMKSLIRHDSLVTPPTSRSSSPPRKSNDPSLKPLEIEMISMQVLEESSDHEDDGHDHANLNMCSAYTVRGR